MSNLVKENEMIIKELEAIQSRRNVEADFKITSTYTAKGYDYPLKIMGEAVHSGEYIYKGNTDNLMEEDLMEAAESLIGKKIYKSHGAFWLGDQSISNIVGKVVKSYWSNEKKAIMFEADIVDRDVAEKILYGLINSVSVGFTNKVEFKQGKRCKTNILFHELTLTDKPVDKKALFTVMKKKIQK